MRALAPHWGALLALALFLAAGLAVLDDYGVVEDEIGNRARATTIWGFLGGDNGALTSAPFYVRVYGPSFELALLFAERALGLDHARGVHLSNHLILHCFFLAGGLFAYLITRRLWGDGRVALVAMAVFLLHPRIYAHSFFNNKDIAFLAMFIIALFLAHRAFRRDTLWAFVLLGAAVGVLVNLRIMGVVLVATVPALRVLDLAFAQGWAERKRIIFTMGVFALSAGVGFFALLPYLWADPVGRAVEWWTTLSNHPDSSAQLFGGATYPSTGLPREYLPVWFSITSPPFLSLLGCIATAAILAKAIKAPRGAFRNTRLRFGLLLIGCFTLPLLSVMLFDVNIINGWRRMYFLWAPFALLAAFGLQWLVLGLKRARLGAAAYGAAGAGLAAALISMALIHPNQHVYFNFLVDRATPEHLRTQYDMDYWRHPTRQALQWLSDNLRLPASDPSATPWVREIVKENAAMLPRAARERVAGNLGAVVPVITRAFWSRSSRALRSIQVYGNTIMMIEPKDDLRAVYTATKGRDPSAESAFDIYYLDGALALAMEPCAPSFVEKRTVRLRATPINKEDLPSWRRKQGHDPRHFILSEYGAYFDGKCVASIPLPGYPISGFEIEWNPPGLSRGAALDAALRAKANGQLLARAAYDVYLSNNELVYVQEQCDPLDTERLFHLRVFPERADDLPPGRRYELFAFEFHRRGGLLDAACVALFPLPDYPIARMLTGQTAEGGGDLWSAAFSADPDRYRAAYRAVAGSKPLARGAFDLHLLDGDLVYVKERCEQADTEARFFLHIVPERTGDLPERRREIGFDNLDFRFFLNGAWFDGRCAARVPLPPYPIASVRTGQFGSAGEIWRAEFAVG